MLLSHFWSHLTKRFNNKDYLIQKLISIKVFYVSAFFFLPITCAFKCKSQLVFPIYSKNRKINHFLDFSLSKFISLKTYEDRTIIMYYNNYQSIVQFDFFFNQNYNQYHYNQVSNCMSWSLVFIYVFKYFAGTIHCIHVSPPTDINMPQKSWWSKPTFDCLHT